MLHNTSSSSIFIVKEWFYAILKFTEFKELNGIISLKLSNIFYEIESQKFKVGRFRA